MLPLARRIKWHRARTPLIKKIGAFGKVILEVRKPLYDLLRNIPLFRVLSNTALMNFADKLVLEIIPADKVVIKEGLPGNALYIIKSGQFKVVNYLESSSEEVVLAELSSGDYFGEMALLTDEPRSASVIALKDSELFKLDKEDFEILLSKFHYISILFSSKTYCNNIL